MLAEELDIIGKSTDTGNGASRCFPYGDNDPGLSFEDSFCEERQAVGHFDFVMPAILWRAAADDVGASIIDASEQSVFLQEFVQGLPCSADEAFPLPVFFGARGFTDSQHFARGPLKNEMQRLWSNKPGGMVWHEDSSS